MRISPVRISKLSPVVIKLSLGKKLPLSENYKLSEVEQSVIILFSDFSENYGDNFSDKNNLSKNFDIFPLKLSLKKSLL